MLENKKNLPLLLLVASLVFAPISSFSKEVNMDNEITATEPREFAENLSNKIIDIINSKHEEDKISKVLMDIMNDNVDTDWMAKFVMGRYYNRMDDELKQKYLDLYKRYLFYSYLPRIRGYSGEKMEVMSVTEKSGDQFKVKTAIKSDKAKGDILVDYRLRKEGKSFKVIDMIGEGVSLITTQRSDFAAPLSQRGPKYFVSRLEKKVKQLENKSS